MKKLLLVSAIFLSLNINAKGEIYCPTNSVTITTDTQFLPEDERKEIYDACYEDLLENETACFTGDVFEVGSALNEVFWGDKEELISVESADHYKINYKYIDDVNAYEAAGVLKRCVQR